MKKKILIVVCIIVIIGLTIGSKYLIDVKNYQSEVAALEIKDIDLSKIADGNYEGSYDANFIKVKVSVDVKENEIVDIKLLQHENGQGEPAEAILSNVIEKQSIKVDTIASATNSSKVILKSIELALEKH